MSFAEWGRERVKHSHLKKIIEIEKPYEAFKFRDGQYEVKLDYDSPAVEPIVPSTAIAV